MAKSLLIINPVSGSDSAPSYIDTIQERLRATFGEIAVSQTAKAGDAREFAAIAVRENFTHIFAAGGDGTLNEVLNGVAGVENGFEQITFGVVPLGTGNDFANAALRLPETIEDALELLAQNRVLAVDVGKVTQNRQAHYFINVSAGGFIAEVSDAVDPGLKSIAGKLAYLIGGAQVLLDFESVKTRIKLCYANGDEEQRIFDAQMFAVCNSKMVGGGRLIAPDAEINDGLFDICVFEATNTLDFLSTLAQVSAGEHLGEESVRYFRAPEIEFEFDREIKINVDGEVFTVRNCRYEIFPRVAKFLAGDLSEQLNER